MKHRGVTLPEVTIALALFLFLLGGFILLLLGASNQWCSESARLTADEEASRAKQLLVRDLRDGLRASTNDTGTVLRLVRPAIAPSGDFDRFREGSHIEYYAAQGCLYRREGTAVPLVLSRGIDSARFAVGGARIGIELTSAETVGKRSRSRTLRAELVLRNAVLP